MYGFDFFCVCVCVLSPVGIPPEASVKRGQLSFKVLYLCDTISGHVACLFLCFSGLFTGCLRREVEVRDSAG